MQTWRSLFEPALTWTPMRLKDRVFVNVEKFKETDIEEKINSVRIFLYLEEIKSYL